MTNTSLILEDKQPKVIMGSAITLTPLSSVAWENMSSSLYDTTDTNSQPKKRAQAGTEMTKRMAPSDLPPYLESDLDELMLVGFTLP